MINFFICEFRALKFCKFYIFQNVSDFEKGQNFSVAVGADRYKQGTSDWAGTLSSIFYKIGHYISGKWHIENIFNMTLLCKECLLF